MLLITNKCSAENGGDYSVDGWVLPTYAMIG